MSKILALDFGLKRTGVAITDDLNIFAFGLTTVDSSILTSFLNELFSKENIKTVVIGLPKRLNNEKAHITDNVYLLKEALEKSFSDKEFVLVDERFTSKMAGKSLFDAGASKKQRRDKELVDKVSATIILQSFLDQNRMK